jgi:hypothetical protein
MELLILYYSSTLGIEAQHSFLTRSWRNRDCVKVVMRPTNGAREKIPWQPSGNTGSAIAATQARRNIPARVEMARTSKFREIVAPAL